MPVTYGNANYRKKFDAFRIVHESGCEPLKKAIECALKIEEPEARCFAWIKIAEFIYAKPKQQLEVSGAVTLEQVLAASWTKPKALDIEAGSVP